MVGADFERINVHHALIGKEFADSEGAGFFEAVPARLNDGLVDVRLSIFEGHVADALFVRKTGGRFEVIFQVSVHEWEATAEGITEEGLAGPVPSHDGPMLATGQIEESVFKNEAIPEAEGGVC
jgi:hypothetical protein